MSSDILNELPADLVALIKAAGFAKVAAVMTGVDVASEHAAYERLGTQFFMRRKEAALIQRGLAALNALGERR